VRLAGSGLLRGITFAPAQRECVPAVT
jgi:hypothetical protein